MSSPHHSCHRQRPRNVGPELPSRTTTPARHPAAPDDRRSVASGRDDLERLSGRRRGRRPRVRGRRPIRATRRTSRPSVTRSRLSPGAIVLFRCRIEECRVRPVTRQFARRTGGSSPSGDTRCRPSPCRPARKLAMSLLPSRTGSADPGSPSGPRRWGSTSMPTPGKSSSREWGPSEQRSTPSCDLCPAKTVAVAVSTDPKRPSPARAGRRPGRRLAPREVGLLPRLSHPRGDEAGRLAGAVRVDRPGRSPGSPRPPVVTTKAEDDDQLNERRAVDAGPSRDDAKDSEAHRRHSVSARRTSAA